MLNYLPLPAFFGTLLLFVAGCGEKLPPDLPKLYPTVVSVIQGGEPLEGANVNLLPKDPNSRWAASGVSNSAGKVDFFTEGKYRGAPEGEYQVTVSKVFAEPSKYDGQEKPSDLDYPTWHKMLQEENAKRAGYRLVDPKYGDRRTSPLELTVGPQQPKDQQIDVGAVYKEELRRRSQ